MGQSLFNGPEQIRPATLTRALLNTTNAGSAVIAKVIAGAGISFASTGADAGTGDVTIKNSLVARTTVSDAAYTALSTDVLVAFTALTAARVVTLPAASAYPVGSELTIVDESGSCSTTNTITVARAGSDTINGATTTVISTAYGYLALESNGVGKWTIVDAPAPSVSGQLTRGQVVALALGSPF